MHKNYKGVYKDTAPIYYEGGAHFKYNDLVNKLYQLQNNNNNNIEENEKFTNEYIKIVHKNEIPLSPLKIRNHNFLNDSKNVIKYKTKKRIQNDYYFKFHNKFPTDHNELSLPRIDNRSYNEKESNHFNMQKFLSSRVKISLNKKDNINYKYISVFHKNENNSYRNSKEIKNLLGMNFLFKNGDSFNDYIINKRKKLNDKFKFNFLQNKIQIE